MNGPSAEGALASVLTMATASAALGLSALRMIGKLESVTEQVLDGIQGVVMDRAGELFVLDRKTLDVRLFGPDGTFYGRWGPYSSGPGELRVPVSMTVDRDGTVYVLNNYYNRVSVYRRKEHKFEPSHA